jgi:hypothetical protein
MQHALYAVSRLSSTMPLSRFLNKFLATSGGDDVTTSLQAEITQSSCAKLAEDIGDGALGRSFG